MKLPPLLFLNLIWLSCNTAKPLTEWYNQPVVAPFTDLGTPNRMSDDNKVFKPKREFIYKFTLHSEGKTLNQILLFKNTKGNQKDSIAILSPRDKKEVQTRVCKIDYLILRIDSTTSNVSLANSQTIMRYLYQNHKYGTVLSHEVGGIIEDSSRIFLHPPRNYQFELLELCPFPQVYFPLSQGKTWTGKLNIPTNWFRFNKVTNTALTVKCSYLIQNIEEVDTKLGKIKCHLITATGESEIGQSFARFYYNDTLGFVKMAFTDPYANTIILDLIPPLPPSGHKKALHPRRIQG